MSVADRASKRMKGDGGPMGAPPPDGYYAQHPSGRYPPYGGGPPPPMGTGYGMWQGGHPPPPHSWGHGSSGPPPPHGSMYQQRGGMQDRPGYGSAYSRGHPPPPMSGPGGVRRPGEKPTGPPPSSRPTSKDVTPNGAPPSERGAPPPPQSGYQGGYYPPHPPPYGNSPYSSGPPPQMHRAPPPQSYGNPPPPQSSNTSSMYGNSPARQTPSRSRPNPEDILGGGSGTCTTTTGTDAPDFDMFARPGSGDDDGNSSVATGGGGTKDKGRGSYKCGRCGVPKKGHVCPYQPKVTRKIGEPLPEMRSAAIQVEMDEFMTLRRLNLRIQGFPESYASEPQGEDMVVGEPHQQHMSPMPSQRQQDHGDMMNAADNGPATTLAPSGHDAVVNLSEDALVGAT